ncbi:MAG: hypothetical protein QM831_02840 [Kofleriaceae bacterium]
MVELHNIVWRALILLAACAGQEPAPAAPAPVAPIPYYPPQPKPVAVEPVRNCVRLQPQHVVDDTSWMRTGYTFTATEGEVTIYRTDRWCIAVVGRISTEGMLTNAMLIDRQDGMPDLAIETRTQRGPQHRHYRWTGAAYAPFQPARVE